MAKGIFNSILERMKLRNAQPISTTAQYNFDQIDPNQEGAGHAVFTHNITGSGTNVLQTKRSIAKAQAHLDQTVDPQLRIQIQNGINMLAAQLTRSAMGTANGLGEDRTVPDNTSIYKFSGMTDEGPIPASDQNPISSFAAFQLFGTTRQKATKVQPHRYINEAGSLEKVTQTEKHELLAFRNVNNPHGHVFVYDRVSTATAPAIATKSEGQPFVPGRTFHDHASTGPAGRGHTTSKQISRGFTGHIRAERARQTPDKGE